VKLCHSQTGNRQITLKRLGKALRQAKGASIRWKAPAVDGAEPPGL